MREDAIREHLSPPPAHIASNLHLAASAAQSEASAAQSPAEAEAAHAIKTAADAAKALPVINAAIQQNERECVPSPCFCCFQSGNLLPFLFL
jgi:regulator of protease activity HflC (stomatin/prohibitin superfamily)